MTVTEIDVPQTLVLLQQVVAEKGADYVDPNSDSTGLSVCEYFTPDGAPSCIVGHVLAKAGLRAETEDDLNDVGAGDLCDVAFRTADDQPVGFTYEAAEVLAAAQCAQDRGMTWGEALAAATYVAVDEEEEE